MSRKAPTPSRKFAFFLLGFPAVEKSKLLSNRKFKRTWRSTSSILTSERTVLASKKGLCPTPPTNESNEKTRRGRTRTIQSRKTKDEVKSEGGSQSVPPKLQVSAGCMDVSCVVVSLRCRSRSFNAGMHAAPWHLCSAVVSRSCVSHSYLCTSFLLNTSTELTFDFEQCRTPTTVEASRWSQQRTAAQVRAQAAAVEEVCVSNPSASRAGRSPHRHCLRAI